MIAKKGTRKAKETPCMIGSLDPMVTWRNVATPEQMKTELIRTAMSTRSIPIAGPRINGTRMVAPNMVRTC
jgi:hypothetical protein